MMDCSPNVCDKCGGQTEVFREGRTQGVRCTRCDWSLVTTYTPPIQLDQTKYEVRVEPGDYRDPGQINIQSIQTILSRMAELLSAGGVNDWALALEKFGTEMAARPDATCAKILSSFGGMGSLNDLVLCKNGQPLIAENGEFDVLRTKLYGLCHE